MFDYPLFETLLAVETEGTFERAAKSQGMTRSAISQKIKLFEERWGAAVITRKPVSTTRLGHRMCRHVEHVKLLETKLRLNFAHLFNTSDIDQTAIELSYDRELLPTGFLERLAQATDRQCDFLFDTIALSGTEIVKRIETGKVKTAIAGNRVNYPLYQGRYIGSQTFLAVAGPKFVKRHFPVSVDRETLRMSPAIAHSASKNLCTKFVTQLYDIAGETNADLLPSTVGILNACVEGRVWAMLPLSLIRDHLGSGSLINLCPDDNLKLDLYFYISKRLANIIPQAVDIVVETADAFLMAPEHVRVS